VHADQVPDDLENQVFEILNARKVSREIETRRHMQLLEHLKNLGKTAEATFLRCSRFKGSGRWLSGPGGLFYGKFGFRSNNEYKVALRTRLLLSPALSGVDDGSTILCRCGTDTHQKPTPFHALDCDQQQWYFKHRHDAVRDTLVDFLKQHSSDVEGEVKVYVEPKVFGENIVHETQDDIDEGLPTRSLTISDLRNNRTTLRADVGRYSRLTSITQYIDVAIVNPAANTYMDLEAGNNYWGEQDGTDYRAQVSSALAHQGSGGTAQRENYKREKYRRILGDRVDNQAYFVPFIVEATGRLGPAARKFIEAVLKESKSKMAKSVLYSQIGAAIARNNAMLSLTWAKRNGPLDSNRF
jgi:hypothetical protein